MMKRTESKSSQLYEQLKNAILSGRYSESCVFPSEVALSRRFGVSRSMMTNVVRELERDGLVERQEYLEVPVRVEYAVTERARTLQPALHQLIQWQLKTDEA